MLARDERWTVTAAAALLADGIRLGHRAGPTIVGGALLTAAFFPVVADVV